MKDPTIEMNANRPIDAVRTQMVAGGRDASD
jgi:hypothetical protein